MNARIIRSLLGILIVLALVVVLVFAHPLVTTAQSAMGIITVNTTAAEYDVVPNNTCSLREAIQTANDGSNLGGVCASSPLRPLTRSCCPRARTP